MKDSGKYAYLSQAEDPVFVRRGVSGGNKADITIIKIDETLVGQEPLLLYYNQHRLKMNKFFEKVRKAKYALAGKEEKVLKEINQYTQNLNNKVTELASQATSDDRDQIINSLQLVSGLLSNDIADLNAHVIQAAGEKDTLDEKEKAKIDTRVSKIQKFLEQVTKANKLEEK